MEEQPNTSKCRTRGPYNSHILSPDQKRPRNSVHYERKRKNLQKKVNVTTSLSPVVVDHDDDSDENSCMSLEQEHDSSFGNESSNTQNQNNEFYEIIETSGSDGRVMDDCIFKDTVNMDM